MVTTRATWPWSLVVGLALLAYLALSGFATAALTPVHIIALPLGVVLSTIGVVQKIRADLRRRER